MDLIVGKWDGTLYYWERAADGTLVAQTGASNPFAGIELEYYSARDWDGDGQPNYFYP